MTKFRDFWYQLCRFKLHKHHIIITDVGGVRAKLDSDYGHNVPRGPIGQESELATDQVSM